MAEQFPGHIYVILDEEGNPMAWEKVGELNDHAGEACAIYRLYDVGVVDVSTSFKSMKPKIMVPTSSLPNNRGEKDEPK